MALGKTSGLLSWDLVLLRHQPLNLGSQFLLSLPLTSWFLPIGETQRNPVGFERLSVLDDPPHPPHPTEAQLTPAKPSDLVHGPNPAACHIHSVSTMVRPVPLPTDSQAKVSLRWLLVRRYYYTQDSKYKALR